MHRFVPSRNQAGFLLLAAGVAVALFLSWQQTQALRSQLCGLLARSEVGLPANKYFHDHPDRLKAALNEIRQNQRDLGC